MLLRARSNALASGLASRAGWASIPKQGHMDAAPCGSGRGWLRSGVPRRHIGGFVADSAPCARSACWRAPHRRIWCNAASASSGRLERPRMPGVCQHAGRVGRLAILARCRQIDARVHSQSQVNNAAALLSCALDGFGIAFIAGDLVRSAIAGGQWVRIVTAFDTHRGHALAVSCRSALTSKLRSFVDLITRELGPEMLPGA